MKEKKFILKLISDDDDKIELLKMKFHGNFNSLIVRFPSSSPYHRLKAFPPTLRRMFDGRRGMN